MPQNRSVKANRKSGEAIHNLLPECRKENKWLHGVGCEWAQWAIATFLVSIAFGFGGCRKPVPNLPDADVRRSFVDFVHAKQASLIRQYERVAFNFTSCQTRNPANLSADSVPEYNTTWSEVINAEKVIVRRPLRDGTLELFASNGAYWFIVESRGGSNWHLVELVEGRGATLRPIFAIFGEDFKANKLFASLVEDPQYTFTSFQLRDFDEEQCWVLTVDREGEGGYRIQTGFSPETGCCLWQVLTKSNGEVVRVSLVYAKGENGLPIVESKTSTSPRSIVKQQFENLKFDAQIDQAECRLSHYGLPEPPFTTRPSKGYRFVLIGVVGTAISVGILWYLRRRCS